MIQQFRSDKKAMTLIELILAIVLLNVIILTGISMELGIRRIFSSTDFEAQLLSEAVPIMMMVAKDINRAVGDIFVPAVDNASYNDTVGAKVTYYIRKDANVNGLADGGDIFAEYRYSLLTDRLDYRPNSSHGGYTRLSDRVANFYISAPVKYC